MTGDKHTFECVFSSDGRAEKSKGDIRWNLHKFSLA